MKQQKSQDELAKVKRRIRVVYVVTLIPVAGQFLDVKYMEYSSIVKYAVVNR